MMLHHTKIQRNTTSANAGTYTVVVTDANGCTSECTVDANYFTPVTITNVSCSF